MLPPWIIISSPAVTAFEAHSLAAAGTWKGASFLLRKRTLLFCFHFRFYLFFRSCRNLLCLNIRGCLLIAGEFIGEITNTAGHGTQIRRISDQAGHGNVCFDDLVALMIRIHAKNTASSLVEVAHDITGKPIRNNYL